MSVQDDWEEEYSCSVCLEVKADIAEVTCCHNTVCETCHRIDAGNAASAGIDHRCPVCRLGEPVLLISGARRRTVARRFDVEPVAPIQGQQEPVPNPVGVPHAPIAEAEMPAAHVLAPGPAMEDVPGAVGHVERAPVDMALHGFPGPDLDEDLLFRNLNYSCFIAQRAAAPPGESMPTGPTPFFMLRGGPIQRELLPRLQIPNNVDLLRSQSRGRNIPPGATWPYNTAAHYSRELQRAVLGHLKHEGVFWRLAHKDASVMWLYHRSLGRNLGSTWPLSSPQYYQCLLEEYVFVNYGYLEALCRKARGMGTEQLRFPENSVQYWRKQLSIEVRMPGEALGMWVRYGER